MWSYEKRKAALRNNSIKVGSILIGRGLKIRILRIGALIVLIELLQWHGRDDLPENFRIHPWSIENLKGMALIE